MTVDMYKEIVQVFIFAYGDDGHDNGDSNASDAHGRRLTCHVRTTFSILWDSHTWFDSFNVEPEYGPEGVSFRGRGQCTFLTSEPMECLFDFKLQPEDEGSLHVELQYNQMRWVFGAERVSEEDVSTTGDPLASMLVEATPAPSFGGEEE